MLPAAPVSMDARWYRNTPPLFEPERWATVPGPIPETLMFPDVEKMPVSGAASPDPPNPRPERLLLPQPPQRVEKPFRSGCRAARAFDFEKDSGSMRIADVVNELQRVLVARDDAFDRQSGDVRDEPGARRAARDTKAGNDDPDKDSGKRNDAPEAELTP